MEEAHEQFFPDDVDEQIKESAQDQSTPRNQLIHDLYKLYQEDTHIIQRVWERLSNHVPERPRPGKFELNTAPLPPANRQGNLARFVNMLAATLFVSLLLSKVFAILLTTQTTPKEPSDQKIVASAPFFYVTRRDGISKIDPQSGAILWHYALSPQQASIAIKSVTFARDMLFFSYRNVQKGTQSLIALNTSNGKPLWHRQLDQESYISSQLVNGVIYISTTTDESGQQGRISAFEAYSGLLRWSSSTDQVARLGSVQQGTIFVTGSNILYTLNTQDGQLTIKRSLDGSFASAPSIIDDVLYASACRSSSCRLHALDPVSGVDLWQSPTITPDSPDQQPVTSNGILYLKGAQDGWIYALDTHDKGKVLWNQNVGASVQPSILQTGASLYLVVSTKDDAASRILALQASNGAIRWSSPLSSGLSTALTVQGNLLYYGSQDGTIQERSLSDGVLLREYASGRSSGEILTLSLAM